MKKDCDVAGCPLKGNFEHEHRNAPYALAGERPKGNFVVLPFWEMPTIDQLRSTKADDPRMDLRLGGVVRDRRCLHVGRVGVEAEFDPRQCTRQEGHAGPHFLSPVREPLPSNAWSSKEAAPSSAVEHKIGESNVDLYRRIEAIEAWTTKAVEWHKLNPVFARLDALEKAVILTQGYTCMTCGDDAPVKPGCIATHDVRPRDVVKQLMKRIEKLEANVPLQEVVSMFVHARGTGALPEGELKEVLKSFMRRPVVAKTVPFEDDFGGPDEAMAMAAQVQADERKKGLRELLKDGEFRKLEVPYFIGPGIDLDLLRKRALEFAEEIWTPDPHGDMTHEAFVKWLAPFFGRFHLQESNRSLTIWETPPPYRPKVVVLCGSTKFGKAFAEANLAETLKGNVVLSVGSMTHSDGELVECIYCNMAGHRVEISAEPCKKAPPGSLCHTFTTGLSTVTKARLDELHKKKIEMADEVFVLNAEVCVLCKKTRGVSESCSGSGEGPHQFAPYIGDSTKSEIEHAKKLGKPIRWLNSPIVSQTMPAVDEGFKQDAAIAIVERPGPDIPSTYLVVWNKKLNVWTMPGGKVEKGERPILAAQRELKEETGVTATSACKEAVFVGRGSVDPAVLVYAFLIYHYAGEPRESEKGSPVAWVTKEALIDQKHVGDYYRRLFQAVEK